MQRGSRTGRQSGMGDIDIEVCGCERHQSGISEKCTHKIQEAWARKDFDSVGWVNSRPHHLPRGCCRSQIDHQKHRSVMSSADQEGECVLKHVQKSGFSCWIETT
jgi:hypothetical protein